MGSWVLGNGRGPSHRASSRRASPPPHPHPPPSTSLHLPSTSIHLHNLPAPPRSSTPFLLLLFFFLPHLSSFNAPSTPESPPSPCRSARGQTRIPTAAQVARPWITSTMSTRLSRDSAPARAPAPMPIPAPSARGRLRLATAKSCPSRMSPTSHEGSRPAPPVGSKR